jgi:hypothetical protein
MDNYRQHGPQVAHNSFVHSYTELGFIGGTLFFGAFWLAITGLYHLRDRTDRTAPDQETDPDLRRLHPFLMSMLVAYTIGICFLSRSYIVPTYMLLGLAVVYMRLHSAQVREALASVNGFVWPRLAGVSFGFLFGMYTFVRVFVQWH